MLPRISCTAIETASIFVHKSFRQRCRHWLDTIQFVSNCKLSGPYLLSKCHLHKNFYDLFGPAIDTPDDELEAPPDWLLESITKVVVTFTPTLTKLPFLLPSSDSSVKHNNELMQVNNFDLAKIINANQDKSLCYRSEFGSIEYLLSIYH